MTHEFDDTIPAPFWTAEEQALGSGESPTNESNPPAFEILLADSYSYQMRANIMGADEAEAKFAALVLVQAWFPHHFWKVVEAKRLN